MTRATYPEGLQKRGRAFWRALTTASNERQQVLEFSTAERETLLEACRTLDRIDDLTAAIDRDGTMIAGSKDQMILHPAIGELRQQQASYVRLVASLNLPEDVAATKDFQQRRAKAGAQGRWGRDLRAVN